MMYEIVGHVLLKTFYVLANFLILQTPYYFRIFPLEEKNWWNLIGFCK